jgi:hypothetical protein
VLYGCFIPIEARPEVTQELVRKAWAVAKVLDSYAIRGDQSEIPPDNYANENVARLKPAQR